MRVLICLFFILIFSCNYSCSESQQQSASEKEYKHQNQAETKEVKKDKPTIAIENPAKAIAQEKEIDKPTEKNTKHFPKSDSNPKVTRKPALVNINTFTDLLRESDVHSQFFAINHKQDTIISGTEGTRLEFAANSFELESGEAVSGMIELKLKEYYSVKDMLAANLSTTSNGKLLETGGMIFLEAHSNGQKCRVKKGKRFDISFASIDDSKKPDMQLFEGKWDEEGNVDWTVNLNSASEDVEITEFGSPFAIFPGGEKALHLFFDENIEYPVEAKTKGVGGRVHLKLLLDKTGEIDTAFIERSNDTLFHQSVLDLVKKMPVFEPKIVGGIAVPSFFLWPVKFSLDDGDTGEGEMVWRVPQRPLSMQNQIQKEKQKQKLIDEVEASTNTEQLLKKGPDQLLSYVMSSTNLGWINCDRFLNFDRRDMVNFSLESESAELLDARIVFKQRRAIMGMKALKSKLDFGKLPKGERIRIVVFKQSKGQQFMATRELKIGKAVVSDFDYQAITKERLKVVMNSMADL